VFHYLALLCIVLHEKLPVNKGSFIVSLLNYKNSIKLSSTVQNPMQNERASVQ